MQCYQLKMPKQWPKSRENLKISENVILKQHEGRIEKMKPLNYCQKLKIYMNQFHIFIFLSLGY